METKKSFLKPLKIIFYVLSCIILGIFFYKYILIGSLSVPIVFLAIGFTSSLELFLSILFPITLLLLFFSGAYILMKWLTKIVIDFKNKKRLRSIVLALLFILLIVTCIIFLYFTKDSYQTAFLMIVYILGTLLIPIIIIGFSLLNKKLTGKKKTAKIILLIVLTIVIYFMNMPTLFLGATYLSSAVSGIVKNYNEEKKPNLEYLENYSQRMTSKGFLYKSDIEYIINIASKRSEKVDVNYSFDDQIISISNKDSNFKSKLEDNLKWKYYKFNYVYTDTEPIVTINIEKFAKPIDNDEKNSDIILSGKMQENLVTNIKSENISLESTNYVIENRLNNYSLNPHNISTLRLLLAYDKNTNNFVPVTQTPTDLFMISSYKVTSTRLEITLNDNTNLNVPDYTLRINRYNDALEPIEDKTSNYSYLYEPGVTVETNSSGQTVLVFEFKQTITLENLKNIEIIFGNN